MVGRVMLVADLRAAALPAPVPGDLPRAVGRVDDGDDQFLPGPADPDPVVDVLVRHRVTHPVDADGAVPTHPAGLPERDRDRLLGQHMQPGPFLGEHLHRCAAGHPVRPAVHLLAEHPAQAWSSSANVAYCSSRFASVGTRSALAIRTVASAPPLVCGSAGTQVRIVIP